MKRLNQKTIKSLTLSIVMLAVIGIFSGCEEEESIPPTCKITHPRPPEDVEKALISRGDVVILSAEAEDADNNLERVRFFVNGGVLRSVEKPPFKVGWDTEDLPTGDYVIKARAIDKTGARGEDIVKVHLVMWMGSE